MACTRPILLLRAGGERVWGRAMLEPSQIIMPDDTLFDEILDQSANVITLETKDVEGAVDQFRTLSRRAGQSVYLWSYGRGLESLKEQDISVPGSRNLVEALRFVVQSMQFGIYVFKGFEGEMRGPCLRLLKRIAAPRTGNQRKLVLLGQHVELPPAIARISSRLAFSESASVNLRLRGGRWMT